MPLYFVVPISVTGVTLNSNIISLNEIGQTFQLVATVLPVDAENKNVVWFSSDTSIATVTQDGLVTCITPGNCSITVTTEDGGFTDICSINDIWAPSSNTLAYYPMTEDLEDHSGNGLVTTNVGVVIENNFAPNCGVGLFSGASSDGLRFTSPEFNSQSFTISWLEYAGTTSTSYGSRFSSAWTDGSWAGLLVGYHWSNLYAGTGTSWNVVNGAASFNVDTSGWHHRVITRDGSTWKTYRDGVLFWSGTASGDVGYNTAVIGNYRPGDQNPYYGRMGQFILERGAWTDTDIAEYFGKIRIIYGF